MTGRPASRIVARVAVAVTSLAAGFYLAAVIYLKVKETALIFPREIAANGLPVPADSLRLPYRTVTFRTADSVLLTSWIVPAAEDESTGVWVILCHGQSGNLATTTRPEYYAYLRAIGVNILAFDWRGFGTSGGTPSEEGLYRDATAAYDYLRNEQRVPVENIVIFGHSLGTAPAIELATRVRAAALVVEGAPTSIRDRAQELYPLLPVRLIASVDFNSLARIKRVAMPILFLHATADERIPLAHGRALFDSAAGSKRFVELSGHHNDAFLADSARYFGEYAQFLSEARRSKTVQAAAQ